MGRQRKFENTKFVGVRVDAEVLERVKIKAATIGKNISEVINELLRSWVSNIPTPEIQRETEKLERREEALLRALEGGKL